ncbi:hypothetical protein [Arcanobacterium phocae]|uniref:hypothetical protein n=1 Tax=Arcanobacterium phocae TaxID=131112 RepID=UPI001C0EB9EE|nr:hypothetical protein [Arcanobacterium phocae]
MIAVDVVNAEGARVWFFTHCGGAVGLLGIGLIGGVGHGCLGFKRDAETTSIFVLPGVT